MRCVWGDVYKYTLRLTRINIKAHYVINVVVVVGLKGTIHYTNDCNVVPLYICTASKLLAY